MRMMNGPGLCLGQDDQVDDLLRAPMKNSLPTHTASTHFGDRLRLMLSTALWFGNSPIIPGTVGTIPATLLFVATALWVPEQWQTSVIATLLILSCALCVFLGKWAENYWGGKDPRHFVLDEVAGFLLTVLIFRVPSVWLTVFWGFLATRAFDVIKPPPAAFLEILPAGWGILIDDLIASLYAAAFLHAASWLLPSIFGL